MMVRDFQRVIGEETRHQLEELEGRLPDVLLASVGGGSNAIGLFYEFLNDVSVRMIGVEAGGRGNRVGEHAARFINAQGGGGRPGVLQGTYSYVLQDEDGQIAPTHSVSAGLDYAAIGPEHAWLHDANRVEYSAVTDMEALEGFQLLSRLEGIIPALESSHAIAYLASVAPPLRSDQIVVLNLSGRGDKDVSEAVRLTQK